MLKKAGWIVLHHVDVDTKFATQWIRSHVNIMNAYWQPNYFLVLRLIVLRSKGSLNLIVEPKIFLLAGQAVVL